MNMSEFEKTVYKLQNQTFFIKNAEGSVDFGVYR